MGQLDLHGFVTPPGDYSGFDKIADTLERRRYRNEQMTSQREGKRAGALSHLGSLLDQKDYLTGTNYDPEIVRQLGEAMNEGAALAQKGADTPTIMMAIGPKVNRINEYSQKAKLINQQKKQTLELLKNNPGIDVKKFNDEFDNTAFYDTDANGQKKLKDITEIDPNVSYGDKILKDSPELVTTSGGFDEFFKQQAKNPVVRNEDIYRYTSTGGLSRDKVKLKYENYLTPDIDKKGAVTGFVPKYEIATDQNNPIMGTFKGKDGKQVDAPVRLLDRGVFTSLPEEALNYIKGQTKLFIQEHEKQTGEKIPLNSLQAENVARMLAYDELNKETRKSGTIESLDINNKPSPQQIRINLGYAPYGSGNKDAIGRIDLREYTDTDYGKNISPLMQGIKVTGLPDGKTLLAENVEYNPQTKRVKYKEYVSQDEQGKYGKGQVREVSLQTFKQNVKTNNPGIDMKFLDGLDDPITGKKAEQSASYKVGNTTLTEDQLKKGAAKYKMTVEEYKKSIGL
jgi:hypothetical protein